MSTFCLARRLDKSESVCSCKSERKSEVEVLCKMPRKERRLKGKHKGMCLKEHNSTETALLKVLNDLLTSADSGSLNIPYRSRPECSLRYWKFVLRGGGHGGSGWRRQWLETAVAIFENSIFTAKTLLHNDQRHLTGDFPSKSRLSTGGRMREEIARMGKPIDLKKAVVGRRNCVVNEPEWGESEQIDRDESMELSQGSKRMREKRGNDFGGARPKKSRVVEHIGEE
ncbi:hypothetical protein F2P81_024075 [Scophthalmus maximus]|uniref:Uncharacterized protein n=1 Tax=Scophthalmus maximus TaxID=52904 RepID=A0A6A4RTD0_SCOMX|nr:hypothetical protein F2P81_024075 [Scophthalmus maximus]